MSTKSYQKRLDIYQSSHAEEPAKESAKLAEVFAWNHQFETGIPELDLQHKQLVQFINELGGMLEVEMDAESFANALSRTLDELVKHVDSHFRYEENLMKRYHCDEEHYVSHKNAYADFIQQITEAGSKIHQHPAEVAGRMLTFMSKWLMTHIIVTDMCVAKKMLAIQSGVSEEEATRQAKSFMGNSSQTQFDAMSRLYENLANRTHVLLETKHNLKREIKIHQLSETELHKFSGAVEYSPLSIIITNSNGKFEYVNPKFTQLTGYSLADLADKTPSVLKSDENPDALFSNMWETLTAGREWRGELRNRKKNGELYWDYAAISPVFDMYGKISYFVSIQENITERKLAETNLRQQKQFSDEIINSLPGIFYMLNPQGRLIRVNAKLMEVTGYSNSEIAGMTVLDFFAGRDRELIEQNMHKAFAKSDSWTEAGLIIKSGQKIPYYFTGHSANIDGQSYLIGLGTDITERLALQQELRHQAMTDLLTNLSNRRHFFELAEQELARTKRYGKLLSVMMLDLDEFKAVNDTYGHLAGDQVLRKVGDVCRQTLREVDIVARIGGEEFAILLPESDAGQAMEVAERLRCEIANSVSRLEPFGELKVTASIGLTTLSTTDTSIEKLLDQADKALYEAKRSGRNKVCVAA